MVTDPSIFLKAPLAPIYTNFEGERAPKKRNFFNENFSKSAQKPLFRPVFLSSENQFGRPINKKVVQDIQEGKVLQTRLLGTTQEV